MSELGPSMRAQLIEARERINDQLEQIDRRTLVGGARGGGPPDYRSVSAELREELREINALLDSEESPDA